MIYTVHSLYDINLIFESKKEHDTEDMLHSISNFEEEKAEKVLKKKEKQERIAKKKSLEEEDKLREANYHGHPAKYPIGRKYYPFPISEENMKFGFIVLSVLNLL